MGKSSVEPTRCRVSWLEMLLKMLVYTQRDFLNGFNLFLICLLEKQTWNKKGNRSWKAPNGRFLWGYDQTEQGISPEVEVENWRRGRELGGTRRGANEDVKRAEVWRTTQRQEMTFTAFFTAWFKYSVLSHQDLYNRDWVQDSTRQVEEQEGFVRTEGRAV